MQTTENNKPNLPTLWGISQLKLSIISNFASRIWTTIMSLAFVPIYIKFIGIEAYGLIGIYTSLQTIFSLLDLGLAATLNKELAVFSTRKDKAQDMHNLLRTLELIYWGLTGTITILLLTATSFITRYWVNNQNLSHETVDQAFYLISFLVGSQFLFTLYTSGMLGIQRQFSYNVLIVIMATLRGGGVILVLWLLAPTIQVFLAWQLLISSLQTFICRFMLNKNLPKIEVKSRFDKSLLTTRWKFALGVAGISLLSLSFTQLDKIILSSTLSLQAFGYYSLANLVSSGLYVIINPITVAMFPQFSRLVALQDVKALSFLYHRGCQLVSVVLFPIASFITFFAPEILTVWTGNSVTVANTALLMSLLTMGTIFNCLMYLPYQLMLAHNWTKFIFYQNLIAATLLVPSLFWAIANYGAVGAGMVWLTLNLTYMFFGIQIMHTRLLKVEKLRWYKQDVLPAFLAAFGVGCLIRWWLPTNLPFFVTILELGFIGLVLLVSTVFATPLTRNVIHNRVLSKLLR